MRWNIRPPTLPAIVSNVVSQGVYTPKRQTAETEIESWELLFNNAMLSTVYKGDDSPAIWLAIANRCS